MGETYTLRDLGYPWKSIVKNRKQIGRVYKHVDGHWCGKIGPVESIGSSSDTAFNEVVAKDLGFPNYEALANKNRMVRARERQNRQLVNQRISGVTEAFNNGDTVALIKELDKLKFEDLPGAISAVAKEIAKY